MTSRPVSTSWSRSMALCSSRVTRMPASLCVVGREPVGGDESFVEQELVDAMTLGAGPAVIEPEEVGVSVRLGGRAIGDLVQQIDELGETLAELQVKLAEGVAVTLRAHQLREVAVRVAAHRDVVVEID